MFEHETAIRELASDPDLKDSQEKLSKLYENLVHLSKSIALSRYSNFFTVEEAEEMAYTLSGDIVANILSGDKRYNIFAWTQYLMLTIRGYFPYKHREPNTISLQAVEADKDKNELAVDCPEQSKIELDLILERTVKKFMAVKDLLPYQTEQLKDIALYISFRFNDLNLEQLSGQRDAFLFSFIWETFREQLGNEVKCG